jgi:hypothetical protein
MMPETRQTPSKLPEGGHMLAKMGTGGIIGLSLVVVVLVVLFFIVLGRARRS